MILNACVKQNEMVDEKICKTCSDKVCGHAGELTTKERLKKGKNQMCYYCSDCCGLNHVAKLMQKIKCYSDLFRQYLGSLICHYKGHKIKGKSYANTESGGEYLYCERCGWEKEIVYY